MVGLAPEMLYALTTHLPSVAVARLACTCTLLADALLSDTGAEGMQGAAVMGYAVAGGASTVLAFQPKDDPSLSGMRLHGLLPLPAIGAYVSAFRSTGVEVVPFPGLTFSSHAELEAAAVTLLELAEAGGSVVGIDWRIDLDRGWELAGHDKAVQGNLDPIVLLTDRDTVRRRTREVLAQAAGRPGHIFNLGHGVLPGTPVENVLELIATVKEG